MKEQKQVQHYVQYQDMVNIRWCWWKFSRKPYLNSYKKMYKKESKYTHRINGYLEDPLISQFKDRKSFGPNEVDKIVKSL